MKIAYPLDYGSQKCFGLNHWTLDEEHPLHENAAKNFSCDDGVLSYDQWTTMTCEGNNENGDKGEAKTASVGKCARDMPTQIWSQILSGCGKSTPTRSLDHQ